MKTLTIGLSLLMITHLSFATDHLAATVEEATGFLEKAKAGDRVLLKNGTYRNASVRFQSVEGTPSQPVLFAAETPGRVFFEGNSTLAFSGSHIVVSGFTWQNGGGDLGASSVVEMRASHSQLADCAIINYNSRDTIDNKWISLYGEYNTVTRCLLKDKRNLGATLTVWLTPGKEARHTISYNYFLGRHNGPEKDNGLESIRIGDSKTSFENAHCVVALNRFENCDGEIEIISNKSCHNSYLHNTFYSSDGGLTLRHGNECLVDGNYFDGAGKKLAYGIRFIGEGHVAVNNFLTNLNAAPVQNFRAPVSLVTGVVNTPINGYFQVRRAVVAGNVWVNCAAPNIRIGATPNRPGATLAPDSVTIENNLFLSGKGSGPVYEEVLPAVHLNMENNKIVGRLKASAKGFENAKMDGREVESLQQSKTTTDYRTKAGAAWVDPAIAAVIAKKKYTVVTAKEVGPSWRRK